MIDHDSRYAHLNPLYHTEPDGRRVAFLPRRFLPPSREIPLLVEVAVEVDDRLDSIAARALGDADQLWRICEANDGLEPRELTARVGRQLRVPIPQFPEPELPDSPFAGPIAPSSS